MSLTLPCFKMINKACADPKKKKKIWSEAIFLLRKFKKKIIFPIPPPPLQCRSAHEHELVGNQAKRILISPRLHMPHRTMMIVQIILFHIVLDRGKMMFLII